MTRNSKLFGLLFLSGALVSLILLAASLSGLLLSPGTPFPGGSVSGGSLTSQSGQPAIPTISLPILRGFLTLIFLILVFYLPIRLLTATDIRKTLLFVLAVGVMFLLISIIPQTTPDGRSYSREEIPEAATPPSYKYPIAPIGEPPKTLIWLVIAGVSLGMGFLTYRTMKAWTDRSSGEDPLIQEVEHSINALIAGQALENVIIRCYMQMSRSLREEQGIERVQTMTVREFEHLLAARGFPSAPVHQLTSLFERARYGKPHMKDEEEALAMESLNEIVQFGRGLKCGE